MSGDRRSLDGLTLFRFAHAFEDGGGVERHLVDLNRVLASRQRLTTVLMRLASDAAGTGETEERIEGSRVLHVPLRATPPAKLPPVDPHRILSAESRTTFLDHALPTWAASQLGMRVLRPFRQVPARTGAPTDAGVRAEELFRRFRFDLAILHTSGGADASQVLAVARRHQVPAIFIHHFANSLLGGLSVRQQVPEVEWVGGASAVGVPRYLRERFTNLSDSVDLDFFDRSRAKAPAGSFDAPVLYVPARLTPEKGQMDVVRAAALMRKEGQAVHVVFAGRVDSPAFEKELRKMAQREGMEERIHFLGPVGMESYRDHFKIAAAMPLLSRHVEGMPRTLVDSQAMEVPPVVYDAGGSREGLRPGETGFLVKPGDLRAVADALKSLVARPELRERMGRAGRAFVSDSFGPSQFAARHEELYLQVIDRFRKALAMTMAATATIAGWSLGGAAPLLHPFA